MKSKQPHKLAFKVVGIMLLIFAVPSTIGALLAIQEGWTIKPVKCHCYCK